MPNWFPNALKFEGPEEDIASIFARVVPDDEHIQIFDMSDLIRPRSQVFEEGSPEKLKIGTGQTSVVAEMFPETGELTLESVGDPMGCIYASALAKKYPQVTVKYGLQNNDAEVQIDGVFYGLRDAVSMTPREIKKYAPGTGTIDRQKIRRLKYIPESEGSCLAVAVGKDPGFCCWRK